MKYKNRKARSKSAAVRGAGGQKKVKTSSSMKNFTGLILTSVKKAGKRGVSLNELMALCKAGKSAKNDFHRQLKELTVSGVIVEYKRKWTLSSLLGAVTAQVVRLNKTFGFVRKQTDETDLFVAGKFLMGAMPGDTVLVKEYSTEKGPEGRVLSILKACDETFTGVICEENGAKYLLPDRVCNFPLRFDERYALEDDCVPGQKAVAKISRRGRSHSEHRVRLTAVFGSADSALSCADAYLEANGVSLEFPDSCDREAKRLEAEEISDKERGRRENLTSENIFTIDSAESKDLDDAVSLKFKNGYYYLGVHIADVSHYVKDNSALDREAFKRGTSIYFADRVIPMLPKELSNGVCSLNPGEERLAFSALIKLSRSGGLVDFDFKKSVIKSRVKGVYTEINSILKKSETEQTRQKYDGLYDDIFLMDELADKLIENRRRRGAPEIDTPESKIIVENSVAVDVVPRKRGKSEMIIEEFMLMANRCAAIFARENGLPFVNRVHEEPPEQKIEALKTTLRAMGVSCAGLKDGKNPAELSEILKTTADLPTFPAINRIVVRSMAKAKYASDSSGHYGLALDDYAHFTSPIRRYPDLTIHRIMSLFLAVKDREKVQKRYANFAAASANQSTQTELRAMETERGCEDCYKAEYMKKFVGEQFDAHVSSVTSFGFFAELDNTVEGLVSLSSLPQGEYSFDDGVKLVSNCGGRSIALGDPVRVKCVKADVNSGRIDFELIQSYKIK